MVRFGLNFDKHVNLAKLRLNPVKLRIQFALNRVPEPTLPSGWEGVFQNFSSVGVFRKF